MCWYLIINVNLKSQKNEKKNFTPPNFFLLVIVFSLLTNIFISAQIKVESDGKIGIGTTTPTTDLEIDVPQVIMKNGSSSNNLRIQYHYGQTVMLEPTTNNTGYLGYNNYWYQLKSRILYFYYDYDYSDINLKEDIKGINGSLEKVLKMQAIQYKLKPEYCTSNEYSNDSDKRKTNIGFSAQDILEIAPEVVDFDSAAGLYAISYSRIIPILVEALKEQNQNISKLEDKIKNMKGSMEQGTSNKEAAEEIINSDVYNTTAILHQNKPNPFDDRTEIEVYIPEESAQAMVNIYDLQGKQVKSFKVIERSTTSIIIKDSELYPGMYYYSLIVDGEIIDTKQMVLTN